MAGRNTNKSDILRSDIRFAKQHIGELENKIAKLEVENKLLSIKCKTLNDLCLTDDLTKENTFYNLNEQIDKLKTENEKLREIAFNLYRDDHPLNMSPAQSNESIIKNDFIKMLERKLKEE